MAVNINKVYQRVLAIANKEQRGYITPQKFNMFAEQAQLEIFEQYFYDINQFERLEGNSTEYSDMLNLLYDKLSIFEKFDTLISSSSLLTQETFESGTISGWVDDTGNNSAASILANSNNSFTPSLVLKNDGSDSSPGVREDVTLTLDKRYRLQVKVSFANDPDANDFPQIRLTARPVASSLDGIHVLETPVVAGEFYTLEFLVKDPGGDGGTTESMRIEVELDETSSDSTEVHFSKILLRQIDGSSLPTDVYRIGEVMHQPTGTPSEQATIINRLRNNEVRKYNNSPLTKATASNPAYYIHHKSDNTKSIKFLPNDLSPSIRIQYTRKPTTPAWGYNLIQNKPLYNSNTSTNFELHDSEENTLIYKILQLSGIAIGKQDVYGVGTTKLSEEVQQEKS